MVDCSTFNNTICYYSKPKKHGGEHHAFFLNNHMVHNVQETQACFIGICQTLLTVGTSLFS